MLRISRDLDPVRLSGSNGHADGVDPDQPQADGQQPRYGDLFGDLPTLWRYIAGNLLYSLIILGGLLLLVIPGVIWSIQYQFAPSSDCGPEYRDKRGFQKSAPRSRRASSGICSFSF